MLFHIDVCGRATQPGGGEPMSVRDLAAACSRAVYATLNGRPATAVFL